MISPVGGCTGAFEVPQQAEEDQEAAARNTTTHEAETKV